MRITADYKTEKMVEHLSRRVRWSIAPRVCDEHLPEDSQSFKFLNWIIDFHPGWNSGSGSVWCLMQTSRHHITVHMFGFCLKAALFNLNALYKRDCMLRTTFEAVEALIRAPSQLIHHPETSLQVWVSSSKYGSQISKPHNETKAFHSSLRLSKRPNTVTLVVS